ncbi:2-hydroxyacyl-CoA dehydratase subunit D [Chloroflexota bacterium]
MAEEVKVNRLETTKIVHDMVETYYASLEQAREEGKRIAWVVGQMPYEMFVAMDIPFVQWENYAARCAARKGERQFKATSEAYGFTPETCSYSRIGDGCALLGDADPATVERPDLLMAKADFITTGNPCPTMGYWFEAQRRIFKRPSFCLDIPVAYNPYDKVEYERIVKYIENQLVDYTKFLEEMTGRRFDMDRLKEIMKVIKKSAELRQEVMEMTKSVPAPMSFFDSLITLAPINILRGVPGAIEYFEKLKAEVKDRVDRGIGVIPNERHRLWWDHIGIWYKVGALSKKFASYGAVTLIGYYTHIILYHEPEYIDPDNPFRSIAEALFLRMTLRNASMRNKVEEIVDAVHEFKLDGLIMHSSRTCRPMDYGQADVIDAVRERTGVPGLLLETDHCDPGYYDEAYVNNSLETFFELLDSGKAAPVG